MVSLIILASYTNIDTCFVKSLVLEKPKRFATKTVRLEEWRDEENFNERVEKTLLFRRGSSWVEYESGMTKLNLRCEFKVESAYDRDREQDDTNASSVA